MMYKINTVHMYKDPKLPKLFPCLPVASAVPKLVGIAPKFDQYSEEKTES